MHEAASSQESDDPQGGEPERIHWSIPDPASTRGAAARHRAFEETAQQLMTRIRYFLMKIERAA